jgi:hypothetical protein
VIQRAISDGAFRRQLQSDPATALRGFNLSPDEIDAIRSGDSSKLISFGVDQRMSKAYTVGGGFLGATRDTTSDLNPGGSANALVGDDTSGARDGIIGDPTSNAQDAHTTGSLSGVRAVNDVAPFEGNVQGVSDPTISGTRAIHDDAPGDMRSAASVGDLSGTRSVNDVAPFGTPGTSAVEDPNAPEFGATVSDSNGFVTRAMREGDPFAGQAALNDDVAAAAAGRGGSLAGDMSGTGASADQDAYSGTYLGVSPDFQAGLGQATASDSATDSGGNMIAADDNYAVSSRMADAGTASSIRSIHDVEPFEGNANAAAPSSEFLGGDARLDPGIDSAHGFIPSDSADVQREMLEGGDHGNAIGNNGPESGDEHSWG